MIESIVKGLLIFCLSLCIAVLIIPIYVLYKITGHIKWSDIKKLYLMLIWEDKK